MAGLLPAHTHTPVCDHRTGLGITHHQTATNHQLNAISRVENSDKITPQSSVPSEQLARDRSEGVQAAHASQRITEGRRNLRSARF
jgi:hypothetical protein